MVDTAQCRHEDRVARMLPTQIVGVCALQQQRHQPAADTDDAAGHDQRDELGPVGVVAETDDPLLIIAQRLHQPPERCMRDPPEDPE